MHAGTLALRRDGTSVEATAGDSLLADGEGGRIVLEGGGEVVLVKFSPRTSAAQA